ncbi:hypothetical protein Esi_0114_0067 [Ectocarpus siliculosus]|uniref:Uncharacterized protein n=1 Tax=Ectocarpus siliculosus TaxID=2880 RepID=D8LD83_ECTSI|nr:hypothetical protein Esi_0114_0067 [Ectocarpus siliculosus]|eukprot:CBN75536.1 hypothetical protein Esi_0114_0067 [Ectocarpus siliculosus]
MKSRLLILGLLCSGNMVAMVLPSGRQTWYVKLFSFRSVLPPNPSGTIPPELGGLTALTWLSLSDNNLSVVATARHGFVPGQHLLKHQAHYLKGMHI